MKLPEEKIDVNIFKISARLRENGFKSYLVGGAVRDIVFGREPKDFDLATEAPCEKIRAIFRNVVPYGMKHGTVIVVSGGKPYDVTSFMDGTAPPLTLENDLAIRDFTINAMACDMESLELIDPHGGLADFDRKIIRGVENPVDRFVKDPLRLLRAIRQAAHFGFSIDELTFAAMKSMGSEILKSAPERISSELIKTFSKPCPHKYVRYLFDSGIWAAIAEKYLGCRPHDYAAAPFFNNFLISCDSLSTYNYRLRLSLLMIFTFYADAECKPSPQREDFKKLKKRLRELKFSGDDFDSMAAFTSLTLDEIQNSGSSEKEKNDYSVSEKSVKNDMVKFYSKTSFKKVCGDVYLLSEAFLKALSRFNGAQKYYEGMRMLEDVARDNHPIFIEDLAVDGCELIKNCGIGGSARIGEMLRYAQDIVINNPADNRKEFLISKIMEKFRPDKNDES